MDSLGKTIQTLARIVEGRPKKSDKEEGWSPSTLYVFLLHKYYDILIFMT